MDKENSLVEEMDSKSTDTSVNSSKSSDLPLDASSSEDSLIAEKHELTESDDESEDDEGEQGWMGMLQNLLSSKLKIEENKVPPVLPELTIDALVNYIQSEDCKNIITMAGAGISTSAGIPDFRSPESGLYNNLSKYNLPHPEAIFDIEYFKSNPKPFFVLAKELYPGAFKPTPSHLFIKLLHDKGLLLRHYTQNIDTLEHVAGLPAEKMVEAHGTFRTAHCLTCNKDYTQDWVKVEIFADNIPTCTSCSGLVKPDIVFFREGLPERFFTLVDKDFKKCDLLIIMGTSLTVQPFASLVDNVPKTCPRLLINREKVGTSNPMTNAFLNLVGNKSGLALDSDSNDRDLAIIGDCDDGCRQLANKLGWKADLDKSLSDGQKT